VKISRIKLLK